VRGKSFAANVSKAETAGGSASGSLTFLFRSVYQSMLRPRSSECQSKAASTFLVSNESKYTYETDGHADNTQTLITGTIVVLA